MLETLTFIAVIYVLIKLLAGDEVEENDSAERSSSNSSSRPTSTRPSLDLDTVDTNTLRKAAKELGIWQARSADRRRLIKRIKAKVKNGGISNTLQEEARSSSDLSSRKSALSHSSSSKKRRGISLPKKLTLSQFIISSVNDSSLRRVIGNANSYLVSLRNDVGDKKYGRTASIRLAGEAIVAFQMASQMFPKNLAGASSSDLSSQQAKRKVKSLREDLYEENEQVFDPYFENEPGVVDLDLSLLRSASKKAANGDETALFQIEYMFAYYHVVLGMYYGWQSYVLSGMSVSEAASKVSGTTGGNLHPPTLTTLTAHFGAVLVKQHPGTVGKFEPLYAPPSHQQP